VAELEGRLQEHYGKCHALCVPNATDGLLALAIALGLEEESFVTTPLAYEATLSGWLHEGNRPLFADVEASTLTIDPESVEQHVGPDTKVLLSVDLWRDR
jgi:dTDP-4-amino-4,6-dideoxygalactose transaminase